MIVAYDLRYACDHFPGIGAHAYELLEALLEIEGDEHWMVLWNPRLANTRFDFERLKSHPRVTWVERPFPPLGLGGLVQTGRWLRGSGATVYLSPFHLLPLGAGCPCVVTAHDVRPLRQADGLSWWQRGIVHLGLLGAARARTIIAISDFSRLEIERALGLRNGKVRTVRSGIRARRIVPIERRPESMPDGDFALVVGDNRPHKNLAVLAKAWARLGASAPLNLVSVGPQHPRYPSLARLSALHGAPHTYGLGWVGSEELEWLYRRARMLLLPSRYEGFGIPMVEAFAHGVPVLAADIPVLREIGGDIPRFVDPTQPQHWADEIVRLSADTGARERMREAGLACTGLPSYRDTARATLEILREAARGD